MLRLLRPLQIICREIECAQQLESQLDRQCVPVSLLKLHGGELSRAQVFVDHSCHLPPSWMTSRHAMSAESNSNELTGIHIG
jgi:hypothetical protein